MTGTVGLLLIFVFVFGGYTFAGGNLAIVLHALPHEFLIIGGAAIGAFIVANDVSGVRQTIRDLAKAFRGPSWKPDDYRDLLCLLFELIRVARQDALSLEEHIESPGTSAIFARYPRILRDREAIDLICDTLRSAGMNYDDPHQVEDVLEKRMETNHHRALRSSHALQNIADALPALGIVAAVLGVIRTMASVNQPPEVLGAMIGSALVGTFLGVFLAYGMVGPVAARMATVANEDGHFYQLIREVLVANLHAHAANICIEVGRQNTPSHIRPTFSDLEAALRSVKEAA